MKARQTNKMLTAVQSLEHVTKKVIQAKFKTKDEEQAYQDVMSNVETISSDVVYNYLPKIESAMLKVFKKAISEMLTESLKRNQKVIAKMTPAELKEMGNPNKFVKDDTLTALSFELDDFTDGLRNELYNIIS